MAHPFNPEEQGKALDADLKNVSLKEDSSADLADSPAKDTPASDKSSKPAPPSASDKSSKPAPPSASDKSSKPAPPSAAPQPAASKEDKKIPPPPSKKPIKAEELMGETKIIPPPPPEPGKGKATEKPPIRKTPPPPPTGYVVEQDPEPEDNNSKTLTYVALGLAVIALLLAAYGAFSSKMITGGDIEEGAITSSKIAAGAIGNEELAPDVIRQGEPGAPGKRGATGPAGPAGITNVEVKTRETKASRSLGQQLQISCPANQQVVTGGASIKGSAEATKGIAIQQAGPANNTGNTWQAKAVSLDSNPQGNWSLRLTITCAKFNAASKPQVKIDNQQLPAQGNKAEQESQRQLEQFEREYGLGGGGTGGAAPNNQP